MAKLIGPAWRHNVSRFRRKTLTRLRADTSRREAVYFDGYLPYSKKPVRLDRVQKSTTQLIRLFSKCPHGLPIITPNPQTLDQAALFDVSGQPHDQKHFPLQPPFLVPAIIDALRASDAYGDLIYLVSGEADDFCARHTFKGTPACILTSDSDLLVHDLADGTGVVFLRDIYTAADDSLSCALFAPAEIAAQFEVSSTRVAYERARLPQVTVNQLRRVCLEETPDEDMFRLFCRQYTDSEKGKSIFAWNFGVMDPRLSELAYQLSGTASVEPDMYLPTLTENPSRRSAWEPSLALRSMAYVFAAQAYRTRHKSVREHRKIQNIRQHKGTSVKLSKRSARLFMDELLLLLKRCARSKEIASEPGWLLACIAIDVQDHLKSDKRSNLLDILERPPYQSRKSKLHGWDSVHATAHLLAALYSLRLVDQIIRGMPTSSIDSLPAGLVDLADHISRILPSLKTFPDVAYFAEILQDKEHAASLRARVGEVLDIPEEEEEDESEEDNGESLNGAAGSGNTQTTSRKTNNPFDLLSAE